MASIKHYAAVIGHPVAHSLSPRIHRAAAGFLGLEEEYLSCDVSPGDLEDFVLRLRKSERWRGLSVTMPHKRSMAAFIDDASEEVRRLSLLNTVVIGNGRWKGHNTDIAGIVKALEWGGRRLHTPQGIRHKQWLVLGAGATAFSAVAAAELLRAERIAFRVRNPARAADAVTYAETIGLDVTEVGTLSEQEGYAGIDRIADFGVIVSTVPARAADTFASALPKHGLDLSRVRLLDVAYDPWPSQLALAAQQLGATVVDGKYMLFFQAMEQIRLFFPEETRFYGCDPQKSKDFETHVAAAIGIELIKK